MNIKRLYSKKCQKRNIMRCSHLAGSHCCQSQRCAGGCWQHPTDARYQILTAGQRLSRECPHRSRSRRMSADYLATRRISISSYSETSGVIAGQTETLNLNGQRGFTHYRRTYFGFCHGIPQIYSKAQQYFHLLILLITSHEAWLANWTR